MMVKRRHLTDAEKTSVAVMFHDSIDYDTVKITRGSPFALVSATTIGNTINLRAEHFLGKTLELNRDGHHVLIHELAHIWQFQNDGFAYIFSSLFAQAVGLITTGSRRAAYDWRKAHDAGHPWDEWNAERQAQCISDYHLAIDRADRDTMRIAFPYIRRVRHRHGGPRRQRQPS